jgi:hypothetical protein
MERSENVKYLLMILVPRGDGGYQMDHWPKVDVQAHMEFLTGLNKELKASGELVSITALTPPRQAKIVQAGKDGQVITDGVFPESKEFLAGFWMVDVKSPERACEIAARASAAPGVGGAPLNFPIEVRRIMPG